MVIARLWKQIKTLVINLERLLYSNLIAYNMKIRGCIYYHNYIAI